MRNAIKQRKCNIREYPSLVCLLDLTADFGVKTNAVLTPISQLSRRAKLDLLVVDTITHAKKQYWEEEETE